jgi:hypothetical protein
LNLCAYLILSSAKLPHWNGVTGQNIEHRTTGRSETLYLVSCVGQKLPQIATARDFYASQWFKKARGLVEQTGEPWYILSAKHGLVAPLTMIEPYELTLNKMSAHERRAWADRVWAQLQPMLNPNSRIVFLAGRRYREFLVDRIEQRGVPVDVPLAGLGIGEQLHWFKKAIPR